MAEEAAAAWRSAFADDDAQQQGGGGDQSGASGSCEPALLDFAADIDDDPLLQVPPPRPKS